MKTSIRISLLTVVGICAALTLSAQKEISKKFKGIKSIRVSTASADCKIVKSTDSEVGVLIRHDFDEKIYEPTLEQSGDRLELREEFRDRNVNGKFSRWTLTVPEGVAIRFRSGSGSLDAADMKLSLEVNTGSGALNFRNTTGEITVNTGSGDVDLDKIDGIVDVNVGSGTISVANGKGDLRLNCGSGNIRISESNAAFRAFTGSGNVRGRNLMLAASSKFNSGSGDTEVMLAESPKFDISVGSGSGNAALNFSGHEISGEITMMASKSRGTINAPFDFDKVEEISEWRDQVVVKKTTKKGSSSNHITVSTGSGDATIVK